MQTSDQLKKYVLLACMFIAPLLQLIGDSLWITRNFNYSWSIWREASYIFFVPVGFLLANVSKRKMLFGQSPRAGFL